MDKIIEKVYKVSSPYDFSVEFNVTENPNKANLRNLIKRHEAIRGLALDEGSLYVVPAFYCDHATLSDILVEQLGVEEQYVNDSYEVFFVRKGSQEVASWDSEFTEVDDFLVGTRPESMGGMSYKKLLKYNRAFKRAIKGMSEKDIKAEIEDILKEKD